MPRATLIPGEKVRDSIPGKPYVLHSSLQDITGHPGDILDIYDVSGNLITQARYKPLSESDLGKMKYIGKVSRKPGDWEWFEFHHDPDHDQYYVSYWHFSGVDLSDEDTDGGWYIPKEDVKKEPTDEYISLLEDYCHR